MAERRHRFQNRLSRPYEPSQKRTIMWMTRAIRYPEEGAPKFLGWHGYHLARYDAREEDHRAGRDPGGDVARQHGG